MSSSRSNGELPSGLTESDVVPPGLHVLLIQDSAWHLRHAGESTSAVFGPGPESRGAWGHAMGPFAPGRNSLRFDRSHSGPAPGRLTSLEMALTGAENANG